MASFTLEYFVFSLLAILILVMFFYFLYRRHIFSEGEEKPSKLNVQSGSTNRWYDFLIPRMPGKLRHLKHERKHKVADYEHHNFFTEFGKETKKVDNRLFNKIKRIAKHRGSEKFFKNLEEVAEAVKKNQKKILERKEIKGSISKLKEMLGEK